MEKRGERMRRWGRFLRRKERERGEETGWH